MVELIQKQENHGQREDEIYKTTSRDKEPIISMIIHQRGKASTQNLISNSEKAKAAYPDEHPGSYENNLSKNQLQ